MDVKRLPWVPGVMQDLGLDDFGGGFWSAPDGRSLYLGRASMVILTDTNDIGQVRTQHRYPTWPDARWLLDCVSEHGLELVRLADESLQTWN